MGVPPGFAGIWARHAEERKRSKTSGTILSDCLMGDPPFLLLGAPAITIGHGDDEVKRSIQFPPF
jgi:hypothetical protein